MISFAAAVAEAVTNEFCFDCPVPGSVFDFEWLAVLIGLSLIGAIPGFFAGMLIHRFLFAVPLAIRLLIVAAFVLAFWVFLIDLVDGVVFSASVLAAFASYFDGSRVDAEHSSKSFSEN